MIKKISKLLNLNIFAVIIIILLIMGTSFGTFIGRLHRNLDIKTEMYLYEITKGSIKLIESKIKESFSSLDAMAFFVSDYEDMYDKEVIGTLQKYSKKNRNSNILMINKEGKAYSDTGIEYDVSDREYFREVLKGKPIISETIISKANNEEAIILAVPIYKNKEVIGAIAGVYSLDIFKEIMTIHTFDSKGYSIILKKDGQIIAKPITVEYENIFEEMLSSKIASDYDEQDLRTRFKQNRTGVIKYTYEDKGKYAIYSPMGINDWYILSVIPSEVIEKQHDEINKIIVYLTVITIICVSILGFLIIFIIDKNNKELRKKTMEMVRITSYMPGGAKRSLMDEGNTILEYTDGLLKLTGYTKEEIKTLFDNKFMYMVYSEDIQNVKMTLKNQLRRSNQIEVEYRIRKKNGGLIWVLDKGQVVIDEQGRQNFYCVIVDITSQKEAQQQLEYEKEKYKTVLNISDDIIFEYDIIKDEMIYSEKYKKVIGREPIIKNYKQKLYEYDYIYKEDYGKLVEFLETITEENALEIMELRIKKEDGVHVWFSMHAVVIRDKDNKPIRLMGKLSNIDKQKKENAKLLERSQRDSLTKLYNKGTTEKKIKATISGEGKNSNHALMVIDIDDFKNINDKLGHMFGDEALRVIAFKMQKLFRNSDIIGRIGGDEFLVFLKDIISDEIVIEKAEAICKIFRSTYVGEGKEYKVSGSVGIAIYPNNGMTYEELFKKADSALYDVKNTAKDNYKIYQDI